MRILIVSDSPALASGLSRVVRAAVTGFIQAGAEVHVAGWFHFIAPPLLYAPCPIYPALKDEPSSLAKTLEDVRPDVVLAIGDPWDFVWLAEQRAAGARFKLVGYLNIESAPLAPSIEVVLDGFDVITTPSEFGVQTIGRSGVIAIHHGVDMSSFSRIPIARIAGRWTDDTFIVLINGQNIVRKNFPVALHGFALFEEGKSDVLMLANTEISPKPESAPGYNLADVVLQTGLKNIAFETRNHGPLASVDDEHLQSLYSAANVLLLTSLGEGFGLPVLEAMACGVVPVATDSFSMLELLAEDRGILIPVRATLRCDSGGDFCILNEYDFARALEQAYQEWKVDRLRRRADLGITFALSRPWERTAGILTRVLSAQQSSTFWGSPPASLVS